MNAITKRVVTVAASMMLVGAAPARADTHHESVVVVPRFEIHGPHFFDPFWGPWYAYDYAYPDVVRPQSNVRTDVTPKDAEVYVDGYFAGRASDFDGVFKKLHVAPGGHAITFHLQGFQTVTRYVYARPESTLRLDLTMEPLAAGETSAPVPLPQAPTVHR